jgi:hypothetical protein
MEANGALTQIASQEEPTVAVALIGLRYDCWRCHEVSTPLVGLLEVGGDVYSEEFVACDDELVLAFAWENLPLEARTRWRVGEVRERFSKTSQKAYLSNGCASCGALFGEFPLIHEALPEALATEGLTSLIELAVVELADAAWTEIFESRWNYAE